MTARRGQESATRRGGSRGIAALLARVLEPGARRRGFVRATLITDWPRIVGPELGERCMPVRVRFPRGRSRGATLVIRAGGATALELRHMAPQLVERINTYLGMPAIARLAFESGPVPRARRSATPTPPPPLPPEVEAHLEETVRDLPAAGLAAALRALGREVLRHARARRAG